MRNTDRTKLIPKSEMFDLTCQLSSIDQQDRENVMVVLDDIQPEQYVLWSVKQVQAKV